MESKLAGMKKTFESKIQDEVNNCNDQLDLKKEVVDFNIAKQLIVWSQS